MQLMYLRPGLWVLVAVLGVCASAHAAAQWKWRDKTGQVQYSDLPPPAATPEADILQRPSPTTVPRAASAGSAAAASAPLLKPKTADPELEANLKKAEEAEAKKKKAEESRIADVKAENCARARGQLAGLEQGIRIVRFNAKGEREYLDDKGRAEEAQRARNVIASDCK